AQGDAERLLQPHRGRERKGSPPAKHFFQGGKAELGLLGQSLPGDAAARQLFPDLLGDLPALFGGNLLVRRRHSCSLRFPGHSSRRTIPHKTATVRTTTAGGVRRRLNNADHYAREAECVLQGCQRWMPAPSRSFSP